MREYQDNIRKATNTISEAKKRIKYLLETKSPRETKDLIIELPILEQQITDHEKMKADYQTILLEIQDDIHQLNLEQNKKYTEEIQITKEIEIDKNELEKIKNQIINIEETLEALNKVVI